MGKSLMYPIVIHSLSFSEVELLISDSLVLE